MQYHQVVRESILTLGIKPQRPLASWSQPRLGLRISARKQRHLMPLTDQFFREIRHHTLSAAIKLRWTRSHNGTTCAILMGSRASPAFEVTTARPYQSENPDSRREGLGTTFHWLSAVLNGARA